MREHMGLFRGKRTDTGDWVEGNLVNYNPHFEWVHLRLARHYRTLPLDAGREV